MPAGCSKLPEEVEPVEGRQHAHAINLQRLRERPLGMGGRYG